MIWAGRGRNSQKQETLDRKKRSDGVPGSAGAGVLVAAAVVVIGK